MCHGTYSSRNPSNTTKEQAQHIGLLLIFVQRHSCGVVRSSPTLSVLCTRIKVGLILARSGRYGNNVLDN